MSNSITTTGPSSPAAPRPNGVTDAMAALPTWLRLLVGSYPAAKINAATFPAYEAMFADEDPQLMMDAVRTAVRGHRYHTFPTIAELSELVEAQRRLQEDVERDERLVRAREIRRTYQARRAYLKAMAYRGEYNKAAFEELHEDLCLADLHPSAISLRAFMDRYEAAEGAGS